MTSQVRCGEQTVNPGDSEARSHGELRVGAGWEAARTPRTPAFTGVDPVPFTGRRIQGDLGWEGKVLCLEASLLFPS